MLFDREKIRYPKVDSYTYESSLPGIFVIGELTGRPLIKNAITMGYEVMAGLEKQITYEGHVGDPEAYDVIIIGAGPAGLSAAIEADNRGIKYIILEQEEFAITLKRLKKGKMIYSEPKNFDKRGELWFRGAKKEEILKNWQKQIDNYDLNIRNKTKVIDIKESGEYYHCIAETGDYYSGKRVVIAVGRNGNPKKISIDGENFSKVSHYLINPDSYKDEFVCIYGGGDYACEAALQLCETNKVTLITIDDKLVSAKKSNIDQVLKKVEEGKIKLLLSTKVLQIKEFAISIKNEKTNEKNIIRNTKFFTMIGHDSPENFFKKIGLKLQKIWDAKRFIRLMISILITYAILSFVFNLPPLGWLHSKVSNYRKAVPVKIWKKKLSASISQAKLINVNVKDREAVFSQNYKEGGFRTQEEVLFQFVLTKDIREMGPIDENMSRAKFKGLIKEIKFTNEGNYEIIIFLPESDDFIEQIHSFWNKKGYLGGYPYNNPYFYFTAVYSLIVLILGFLAYRRWGRIGNKPKHFYQRYRYIVLIFSQIFFFFVLPFFIAKNNEWFNFLKAWPLGYKVFFSGINILKIWAFVLTFVVIPIFIIWHGKRYCSWFCTWGALAETYGDKFRQYSPKGHSARKWELLSYITLILVFFVTVITFVLGQNNPISNTSSFIYKLAVVIGLTNLFGISLYPIFGGKMWCRYFCPLGKLMELCSKFYSKIGLSRFKVISFDRCIQCSDCNKYCHVGVNVEEYARNEEIFSNKETSCMGCGICITVCPVDNLAFSRTAYKMRHRKED